MKIVFLSYSDFKGGASIAAYSIFKAISSKNSFFLTANKKYKNSIRIYGLLNRIHIFILRLIEKFLIYFFSKKKFHQSLNIFNTFTYKKINSYNADIINLHWINRAMISIKEMNRLKSKKIIISLHDMWFLNSTEHYYEKKENKNFISKYCFKKKKLLLYNDNVYFIAHNKWMLNNFKKEYPKLKEKIYLSNYYPINTNIFKPRNKINLRKKYNLPTKKKIIFFSAQDISDQRKGYIYFQKIVEKLSFNKDLYFLSLGKRNNDFKNLDNYKHIDFLSNENSSELYSLSDIFVSTSIIDNLPLTILEAISSGNLVMSLDSGGAKEVLKEIGYTFKISNLNKFINRLNNISDIEIKKKSNLSRKFALRNFGFKKTKFQYKKIFKQIYKNEIY